MKYLVTKILTPQELIIHTPPRPIAFKQSEKKDLLAYIKKLETEKREYRLEVCMKIDKSEIL